MEPTRTASAAKRAPSSQTRPDHTTPAIAARQETHRVAQTVRLLDTTFVSEANPGITAASEQGPATSSPSAPPAIYASDGALTNVQIGGIVGGVLGFTIVVLALWCFLTAKRRQRRRKRRRMQWEDYGYDTSELSTESPPPPPPPPPPGMGQEQRWPFGFWAGHSPRSSQRRTSTAHMSMPPPPPPPPPPPAYYRVKRAPPWEAKYSGPKRNLRGY